MHKFITCATLILTALTAKPSVASFLSATSGGTQHWFPLVGSYLNADGSTSIFGVGGNAISTTEADGSSLIFAQPPTPVSPGTIPVWFAPGPPLSDLLTPTISGTPLFQTMMHGVAVFKMYELYLTLPDATLQAFFSYLNSKNIAVAVEAEGLVATTGQPGFGQEGFSENASDLTNLLTTMKNDGGNLSYIAWDEPWASGVAFSYTLSQIATQIATSASQVLAIFPSAVIGDIEPLARNVGEQNNLQAWLTAVTTAGTSFAFIQEDIAGWNAGWEPQLVLDDEIIRAGGMQVGAIVNGSWNSPDGPTWASQAMSMSQQLLSDPSVRPDYLIVQSWQTVNSETMDPTVNGSLANVAQVVQTGLSTASSVPAVAKYNTSGVLMGVTWSGGWSAIEDGSTLTLSTPTGVYGTYLQGSVTVFSFNPTTATVSITVSGTAYSVNVAGGQFVITSP